MRMNKKRPVDSMRHLKLIKFYKRPIELRQFTGQTVNLPRMKIDLMKKKNHRRKQNNKKTAQKKLILEMTTQNEARRKKCRNLYSAGISSLILLSDN